MQTYNAAHRAARIDRLAAPVLRWRAYKIRFPLTVGGATRNEKRLAPPDGPFALDHLATIMAIHMGIVCTKCLTLHFIGTSLGIALAVFFVVSGQWYFFPVFFIVGYGFAWFAHFALEKNKPASFRFPFWSFISDFYRGFARDGNYELV